MYVADKSSVSGRDICERAVYSERIIIAQTTRNEDDVRLKNESHKEILNRWPDGWPRVSPAPVAPSHEEFLESFNETSEIIKMELQKQSEERSNSYFKLMFVLENAKSDLSSYDHKTNARGCATIYGLALKNQEDVPDKLIPTIVQNLDNRETPCLFPLQLQSMPMSICTLQFEARFFAEQTLVFLGARALPALRQALSSNDTQIREKVKEIISVIEKSETQVFDKTVPEVADKTTQAPVATQSSDLANNNDKSVMPKTISGLLAEVAFSKGEEGLRSLLAASNININEKDDNGVTALMYAASNADAKTVDILLSAGANIEAKDAVWQTALFYAASNGNIETSKILIEKGLDVNSRDIGLETPLIKAAFEGHVDAVKFLMSLGAKVNDTNINMQTALMVAAYNGRVETVRVLLSLGADKDMKDNGGLTALDFAREANRKEIVELLSTTIK